MKGLVAHHKLPHRKCAMVVRNRSIFGCKARGAGDAAHINHAKIANVCKVVVFLQLRGGKEVEADGKTVVLKSRETIESVKFAVSLWKEASDLRRKIKLPYRCKASGR